VPYVGIDLGTTNSAVAMFAGSGRPEMLANPDGDNLTPTVLHYESKGATPLVGQPARRMLALDPDRTYANFKRHMARADALGALALRPEELAAAFLDALLHGVESRVGDVRQAVITVPANFANEARLATIRAGRAAGLEKVTLVNEPTAALFHYSFARKVEGTVVVYDFGGGTLDVTVAKVDGPSVEIVASRGDPKLGGIDFDARLEGLVRAAYRAESGEEFRPETHQLDTPVEEIKRLLTAREDATVAVAGGKDGIRRVRVTRAAFEEACATLLAKSSLLVDSVLAEAGVVATDVSEVFLVGGSTRMPMVHTHLAKRFGRRPVCHVNPDEVVALGAALYAAYAARQAGETEELTSEQFGALAPLALLEVANHYYGTFALVDRENLPPRVRNSTLIRKNTPLPCSTTRSYFTAADGQRKVECSVTQSSTEEEDPDFVRTVWQGMLEPLPAGRPRGMEIQVTFSYDRNQLMHCSFLDVATGIRRELRLDVNEAELARPPRADG
jgi:molecular chaperone DnaK